MITLLPTMPTPPNSVTRPGSFNADSDATFAKLPEVVTAFNSNVPLLNETITTANDTKAAVQQSALDAAAARSAAEAFALTAVNAPGTSATSTTPLTVEGEGGEPSFFVQAGKDFAPGSYVTLSHADNVMHGLLLTYNKVTGEAEMLVLNSRGAGTYSAWTLALSGPPDNTPRKRLFYFAGA